MAFPDVTNDLGTKLQASVDTLKAAIPEDLTEAHAALDALVDHLTGDENTVVAKALTGLNAAIASGIGLGAKSLVALLGASSVAALASGKKLVITLEDK